MMRRTSLSPSAPRWRRRARRTVLAVVLLAGTGTAVVAVRDGSRTESAPTTTAAVLEVAQVSAGDLSTTESIDGTLTETGSVVVVHRIEGQTSSSAGAASSSSTSSSGAAAPTSATAGATVPIAAAAEALPAADSGTDCDIADSTATTIGASVEPSAVTTTTSAPASTPDDTTTTTTTTATATVVDPTQSSAPSITVTATTVCPTIDPSATSTTTAPAGDVPTAAAPSGAAPIGSAGVGTPSASSSTSGVASSSSARITQVVTWVAPVGTAIGSGDALYSIEGAPVTAMYGDLPAWRSLSTDSDDGVDVLQLEANLRALGFDRDAEMTIDQTFDSDTAAAVERWQAAIGVDVSGEVALGAVVFVPAATAVTSASRSVGDEIGDGDSVVTLAGTTQQIVITVPAEDQPYVEPGTAVTVSDTAATVVALRSAESDGTVTVQAVIAPSSPLDVADGSAVKVRLTIEQATSVLLVPADALVSRLDGTYALQTSAEAGRHEFVTVELLGVSNGMAGVRGDGLTEGTSVWVPA